MRVISGKYRGRKLFSPANAEIRPTTDRAKENLFNILQNHIENAIVIDLFSGSGALGIEALSRGAKKVYFCDNNRAALTLTKKNLFFAPESDYEIVKGDFSDCLQRLGARGVKADIILSDPPYELKLTSQILKSIEKASILASGGKIIIERSVSDKEKTTSIYDLADERKYGDTVINIFQKLRKIAVTGSFDPFTKGHKDLVEKALEDFDRVFVVMLVNPDKKPMYTVEERLKMINLSLGGLRKRVVVEFYDGLTIDYCRKNNIKYILRGLRNQGDLEYEKKIADYNYENGGIKTIFMPALHSGISSTLVRGNLTEEKSVTGLVENTVEEIIKKKR